MLAGVLVGSATSKLAGARSSQAALATFGIEDAGVRRVAWGGLVAVELVLAAGIAADFAPAAFAAAGLMVAFAVALALALARGRAGSPCACFGSRSEVSRTAVVRNLVLAACFAAVPLLPSASLSTDEWLGLGLALALIGCVSLAVAVLALAREVGVLRLQLGPQSALEIPEEGPELGSRTALISRFAPKPSAELAVGVFVSDGCHICRSLEPQLAALARDPIISLELLDEVADTDVWTQLDVPGSPYALALDLDGTVLAKGTFNNIPQLESVLATAERRRAAGGPLTVAHV